MPKTVSELWEEYRARMVPLDADRIQVVETRRAFYSGLGAAFRLQEEITELYSDPGQVASMFEDIHEDVKAFLATIGTPEERMLPKPTEGPAV